MPDPDPIAFLRGLASCDDEQINLAEAALAIARTEYPELDATPYLARLDELAARVGADPTLPPLQNIQVLNEVLFEVENFRGNEEEYDDPGNSFLNLVLERKKGIPITLSLVYMEVAHRRALPVVGVSFPRHFLVKYLTALGEIIIDPYHQGRVLSREDCAERLRTYFGEEAELKPEHLSAATNKQILSRMLNNLKGAYFRRANYSKVLSMIELALAVDSASRQDLRDRGMVYLAMKRYPQAMADFKTYLAVTPADDPQVKEIQEALHRIRGLLN